MGIAASEGGGGRPRVILISNTSWYLWNFRGEMMRRMAERGWHVHAVAPDDEFADAIEALGAGFSVWRLPRRSLSPVPNARALLELISLYRRLRPDIVHHFTIKPVILGGIAARLTGIDRIVQSVTGLGHAFSRRGPLRWLALNLYRIALGGRALTVFQNADDMRTLLDAGVTSGRRCRLIRGSGIDIERFAAIPAPPDDAPVTFLMAGRMLWAKGVREFVEAAAVVRAQEPDTRFLLVGRSDEGSPDAIPRRWLEALAEGSPVEWQPFVRDIDPTLARSHVVVLPSHREGLSRSLLEGAAAGRPVIATDAPGCREIAVDGSTGITVPVGDADALARAMLTLARDASLRERMGARGRELARDEYSLDRVIRETLALYRDEGEKPVRVLHVITGLGTGGAERMLARLLRYGDRERFRPVVVSLRDEGDLGASIRELGVPVLTLGMEPGRPSLRALWRLVRIVRRETPRVIQTWMYHADLIGGIAAKLAGGVPVAWGVRHSDFDPARTKPSSLRVVRLCARLSRHLPAAVMTNSGVARDVHAELGYDPGLFTVIPNGFDLSRFAPDPAARPRLRGELGIPDDAIVISAAARYHPMKDQAGMLEAAAILRPADRDGPPLHFVLCGKDVTRDNEELARAANAATLDGRVHLLGQRSDMATVYAASDIFTSPSAFGEAFPQVVGEAMASGTPCVVTDVGDSAHIVGDTGEVVPPGDREALAAAWERLLALGSRGRGELGARARARIEENFEIGHVVRMFERFHAELADRTRR